MIAKTVPFKRIKIRRPKLKPVWHDFYCVDCGKATREYSDPRVAMFICHNCLCRRLGIANVVTIAAPQADGVVDWWAAWAMEYESKRAAGLIDRYGKDI